MQELGQYVAIGQDQSSHISYFTPCYHCIWNMKQLPIRASAWTIFN